MLLVLQLAPTRAQNSSLVLTLSKIIPDSFESARMGEKFCVHVTANCRTKNIVYLIECRKSREQCIGETENPLRLQMNRHRSADKPVMEHSNMIGHSFEDLIVMVIEKIMADSARRKQRESYWIHTLWTLTPNGLKLDP